MRLEFGMSLQSLGDVSRSARLLEGLEFDYLTSGEHVAFNVPTANSFISLSFAAAVTTRIKLLSAVVPLPLYPAVLAAKLGAALDFASGGRYEMGVGVGGEYPREYTACGVRVEERGARCNEALEVLQACWSGESVSYDGQYNHLADISIAPRPVQEPRPPIWISGRKRAAMQRAAKYGDGWMPYFFTPEMLRTSREVISDQSVEFGRDPDSIRSGVFLFSCCHADETVARQFAVERLGNQYRQDFTELVDRYAVIGTPERCADRICEYAEAGASAIFLGQTCPDGYAEENATRFAEIISRLSQAE